MNYLSICAILRDEHLYIAEWLQFHLAQGVEHFYLYDNESKDVAALKAACAPYEKYITWHSLVGFKQQRVAYNHTIINYRKQTKWVAFLDADEFLFATSGKSFAKVLREDYDKDGIAGLAVHWVLYGSGGQLEYRDAPVRERFVMRAKEVNQHCKSIMRMRLTTCMANDPHTFRHTGRVVDENMNTMPFDYALTKGTADKLRINHYVCKSIKEFVLRKQNPDANSGVFKDPMEQFLAHDKNEELDRIIA